MMRAASCSDNQPATAAAASSPCEWPTTTFGCTPQDCHNPASETLTANSAGCTTSICSSLGASGDPRNASHTDHSTKGASASSHASIYAAKTGERSSSSSAIPSH